VEKALLERYLAEGLSLERIGALVNRHPSTVAYWVRKFGLVAANREKHASRGGIPREVLEPLVRRGLSIRELANELEVSPPTIRHWLGRYGLKTTGGLLRRERRAAREALSGERPNRVSMECHRHGTTEFWLEGRGIYRCLRCRSEAVARRRRKVKAILVEEAGGRCRICGYDRYVGALEFHHLDRETKVFSLGTHGVTRSLAKAREEAEKCVLLCANCHAEVEGGVVEMTLK
jgi:transposase